MDQIQQERKVYLYYGFGYTGKTMKVFNSYGENDVYQVGLGWFIGYQNEKVILFDNFKKEDMSLSVMRRILSRSEMIVQTESGPIDLKPEVTIIISDVHPNRWYSPKKAKKQMFVEGFDEIIFFWSFNNQIKVDKQDFIDNATLWDIRQPTFDKEALKQHIQKTYKYQFSDELVEKFFADSVFLATRALSYMDQ